MQLSEYKFRLFFSGFESKLVGGWEVSSSLISRQMLLRKLIVTCGDSRCNFFNRGCKNASAGFNGKKKLSHGWVENGCCRLFIVTKMRKSMTVFCSRIIQNDTSKTTWPLFCQIVTTCKIMWIHFRNFTAHRVHI